MPQAASAEEARVQADLQAKRQALAAAQQAVAAEKQKLQKIADIRTRITAFKAQMARFYAEIEPALNEAGVPEADRAAFRPGLSRRYRSAARSQGDRIAGVPSRSGRARRNNLRRTRSAGFRRRSTL